MKIENLRIRNFRSHVDSAYQFDRFNFVVGLNAVGKSSIAAAIEFLLTGKCQFTDSRGAGADDLIRIGQKEFILTGNTGKAVIERKKSMKGHSITLNGKPAELRILQQKIYDSLKVTPGALTAVLNAGRFLEMAETEQKELLAQVLASSKVDIPPHVLEVMVAVDGNTGLTKDLSLSDVDGFHEHYYEERTAVNRDLKPLLEIQPPAHDEDMPDPQEVRARLATRRKELTDKTIARSVEAAEYNSVVGITKSKRVEIAARRAAAMDAILSAPVEERLLKISEGRDEYDKLRARGIKVSEAVYARERVWLAENSKQSAETAEQVRSLKAQIADKESAIELLLKIRKPDCPMCSRALSASEKASLGTKLDGELSALKAALKSINVQPTLPVEPDDLVKLRTELTDLCQKIEAFGDIEQVDRQLKTHREAVVALTKCDAEAKDIKEPEPFDPTELDAAIADLTERVQVGEQAIESLREYERALDLYKMQLTQKESLEVKLEVLNRLIEFFGPTGVKTQMVGDKIGPFTEAMNNTLVWFQYHLQFTLDPYTFSVKHAGDDQSWRSVKMLSESEQLRFGIAFQIALAKATGLNFIIVDRADMLDKPSRSALTAMLLESELEQAIIISTLSMADKVEPITDELPPGVKFIQL